MAKYFVKVIKRRLIFITFACRYSRNGADGLPDLYEPYLNQWKPGGN